MGRQAFCAQDSALIPQEESQQGRKLSNIFEPYKPYGLFQTNGETCAKFGSDRFRIMNLYKVQTNKQTFIFIYKIMIVPTICTLVKIVILCCTRKACIVRVT